MAMTYIVGIPRSGKTYYAMYQLWKYFVYVPKVNWFTKLKSIFFNKKKLHNYKLAYTNINQFDFSKTNKIKKLDFNILKKNLTELYNLYMLNASDEELKNKAKELNIYKVLFVIDEVHNILGEKVDEVLKWWLTYHGHLHQDMFLITQDLSLVNSKYKNIAEFFYRAIPPSARLFKNKFRYTQYRNARMAMNGKIADFTIPVVQEIFKMYVSGAENNSKSVIKKYLFIGLFISSFLVFFIYLFINSFSSNDNDTNVTKGVENNATIYERNLPISKRSSNNEATKVLKKTEIHKKENKLFEINCLNVICTYKKVNFPLPFLLNIINKKDVQAYKIVTLNFTKYFVLAKDNAFNFLDIGGTKNDKNKKRKKINPVNSFKLL